MESELESGLADQPVDIYTLAVECKDLFATFLRDNKAEGIHLRQYEHRFLLWASFLGVFADEKFCLDRRLRRAPEIRDLVLLMLRVLKRNLDHATSESATGSATSISLGDRNGPMYGIKEAIDRLHRLATIIRGGTRTDEVQAVRKFASKRKPDGFLGVIMALTRYHFPQAQASLHFQLAKSIAYRRNWLLYQQQHSQKLAKHRTPKVIPPLPIIVEPEPSSQDQAPRNTYPRSEIQSQFSLTEPSIRSINMHLLEVLNLSQQSRGSHQDVTSVYSSNPPPSGFYPTQPSVPEGQRETLCKFCQVLLPTSVVEDEAKWRKHVDADLRPYVCVSEHCEDFPPSFSTVRDWKSHMEEKHRLDWPRYVHRARWTCPRCPKEPEKATFPTEAALARHLSEDSTASHHQVLDAMEISSVTAGCKELIPIDENDCPLCGRPPWQEEWKPEKKSGAYVSEIPDKEGNLSAHFAGHLRYLAFQSLRWWDVDINGGEDESAPSQDPAGFNSEGSKGKSALEDSTAININLDDDDDELKLLQDCRIRAEEEELLEREKHVPTSITETVRPYIPAPPAPLEFVDDTIDFTTDDDFSLRDQIFDAMRENTEGKLFIPADVILRLASRSAVQHELMGIFNENTAIELENYVFKEPAIKVFLILVLCKNTDAIAELRNSGFGDQHLPLDEKINIEDGKRQRQLKSLGPAFGDWRALKPLFSWRIADRREFLEKQWVFMAPVFTRERFSYRLHNRCPLPFIPFSGIDQAQNKPAGGLSGSVQEIQVHEAHQKVLPQRDGIPTRVALKTVFPQMGHYFLQEEEALGVIQNIDHPHLIRPIASYQYHDQETGCFLFPWAERGNLKEFWITGTTRPLKDREMMTWMLNQMCGLCHALSILHDKRYRHGDIKPENILLFEDGGPNGTLRIADVGLSKFHAEVTERRWNVKEITKTMSGTSRYLSPEFVYEDYIPRVFDVWALGCVFIEFLIWALHGYDHVLEFMTVTGAHFWRQEDDEFIIHPEVQLWISNMEKILRDSGTALETLLDLVESEMLVPNWTKRSSSSKVHEKLVEICRIAENDDRSLINPEVQSRARSNPPRSRGTLQNLAPGRWGRRLAPIPRIQDLSNGPVKVPDDGADNSSLMVGVTSGAQQASPVSLPAHGRLQTASRKKYDKLTSQISYSRADNVFAQNLFSNPLWSHPRPAQAPSKLCEECSLLDIWQAGFEFGGLVGDIKSKSNGCDLCLLFVQAVSMLELDDGERFLSRRVESTIRLMPDGPAILSLYSDPERVPASPDAQIGYPLLPKPESPAQFAFIHEWLRVCRGTHQHGHVRDATLNPAELPTRVIDLGDLDKPKLRLVAGKDMKSPEYFALSHCWGKGIMFRAMKDNIEALTKAIDYRRLPRTFQEAIRISRGVNVMYLWIDSLCIIQDDEEDWKREAARMQQVFSNASCVIAASSAGSSAEGFLDPRREDRPFVTLRSPPGTISYVCKYIDNFEQDLEDAPLNKRGWVLQERALARRLIHFTSTQVYLECGEGVHCESLMRLANDKAAFLGDSDFPNSILAYYKGGRAVLFQNLFKMYSTLKFTKSSDRPIAISGLEKRLMSAFKTRGGYGVFQAFFERSILWQRPESGSLARITYPADRNVPSWSWMAYEGSITYVDAPFNTVDWTKDYESPFEVDTGRRYWEANGSDPAPVLKSKSARRFSPSADPDEVFRRIRFDLDRPAFYHQLSALRCIVIGKDKYSEHNDSAMQFVLVITTSSSGSPGAYVRVGVGILLKSLISWDSEEYVEVH